MHSDYGDSDDYVQDVQILTYFSYSYLSIWQLENPYIISRIFQTFFWVLCITFFEVAEVSYVLDGVFDLWHHKWYLDLLSPTEN